MATQCFGLSGVKGSSQSELKKQNTGGFCYCKDARNKRENFGGGKFAGASGNLTVKAASPAPSSQSSARS